MKREIKFRAWDDEDEVIIVWGDLQFERDKGEGIVIWKQVDEATKEIIEPDLMQWTGLKDQKGVEIYEGDIVKIDDSIMRVEYLNGCFDLVGINIHIRDYLGEQVRCYRDKIEVIGNIYENKDLLCNTK